jgi:hypothetical protein
MNSNTAALQTGHHHHHHQTSSSNNSANTQYHHPSTVTTQQAQQTKPAVNPNPSVHRYNSLNDPWQLQSQSQQQSQGPTPPLRQHKRPAPNPPLLSVAIGPSAPPPQTQLAPKPNVAHLSMNSTYNQPVHFSNSTQTQTTPGLAPVTAVSQQISPKSPNQTFLHQPSASSGNLMSTSLNSGNASNMVNNHHHLPPQSHQPLSTSLHHSTSSSLSNNNNNNNFDDLNLNGSSSINAAGTSKLNTMPYVF